HKGFHLSCPCRAGCGWRRTRMLQSWHILRNDRSLQYIHFTKQLLCKNSNLQSNPRHPARPTMIERTLFSSDHEAFRDSFRRFCDKEIAPYHEAWEEQGYVGREVWRKAGANGFLCMTMPEAYGGAGADKLYSVVQMEELNARGFTGIGYSLHSEIVAPYILHYGTEAQKKKYLPLLASGEMVGAIAMSEPAAGSDLQGIKSTAAVQPDGSYLLNGSKTFITNGWHADLVIVVA